MRRCVLARTGAWSPAAAAPCSTLRTMPTRRYDDMKIPLNKRPFFPEEKGRPRRTAATTARDKIFRSSRIQNKPAPLLRRSSACPTSPLRSRATFTLISSTSPARAIYMLNRRRGTRPHYACGRPHHAAFCKTSKTLNNAMISHSKAVFRRMFPAEMMLLGKEPTTPIIVAMDPAKHVRELQGTLDDLATPASAFEKRTMSEMQKLDNDDSVNAVYFWLCQRIRSMLAFYNTRGFTVDRSLATTSFNLEEMNLVVTIEREWCLPHRVGFSAYRAFQQQGISKTKEVLFSAARPLGDVRTSGRRLTRRSSATEGFFELANVLTPKEVLNSIPIGSSRTGTSTTRRCDTNFSRCVWRR